MVVLRLRLVFGNCKGGKVFASSYHSAFAYKTRIYGKLSSHVSNPSWPSCVGLAKTLSLTATAARQNHGMPLP